MGRQHSLKSDKILNCAEYMQSFNGFGIIPDVDGNLMDDDDGLQALFNIVELNRIVYYNEHAHIGGDRFNNSNGQNNAVVGNGNNNAAIYNRMTEVQEITENDIEGVAAQAINATEVDTTDFDFGDFDIGFLDGPAIIDSESAAQNINIPAIMALAIGLDDPVDIGYIGSEPVENQPDITQGINNQVIGEENIAIEGNDVQNIICKCIDDQDSGIKDVRMHDVTNHSIELESINTPAIDGSGIVIQEMISEEINNSTIGCQSISEQNVNDESINSQVFIIPDTYNQIIASNSKGKQNIDITEINYDNNTNVSNTSCEDIQYTDYQCLDETDIIEMYDKDINEEDIATESIDDNNNDYPEIIDNSDVHTMCDQQMYIQCADNNNARILYEHITIESIDYLNKNDEDSQIETIEILDDSDDVISINSVDDKDIPVERRDHADIAKGNISFESIVAESNYNNEYQTLIAQNKKYQDNRDNGDGSRSNAGFRIAFQSVNNISIGFSVNNHHVGSRSNLISDGNPTRLCAYNSFEYASYERGIAVEHKVNGNRNGKNSGSTPTPYPSKRLQQNSTSRHQRPDMRQNSTSQQQRPNVRDNKTSQQQRPHMPEYSTSCQQLPVIRENNTSQQQRPDMREYYTSRQKRPTMHEYSTSRQQRPTMRKYSTSRLKRPTMHGYSASQQHRPDMREYSTPQQQRPDMHENSSSQQQRPDISENYTSRQQRLEMRENSATRLNEAVFRSIFPNRRVTRTLYRNWWQLQEPSENALSMREDNAKKQTYFVEDEKEIDIIIDSDSTIEDDPLSF